MDSKVCIEWYLFVVTGMSCVVIGVIVNIYISTLVKRNKELARVRFISVSNV